MQLLKRRDFGLIFTDTIAFIKQNGGHFFKLFFTLMGLPLIILGVAVYLTFRFNMGMIGDYSNPYNMVNINEDFGLNVFFSMMGLLTVFAIIQIFIFAFTPLYMMLYNEYGKNFTANDMLATYKSRLPKIIKFSLAFFLACIILFVPLVIILGVFAITLIGILFIPVIIGFMFVWYHNAYLEYLNTTSSIMNCIQYGFQIAKSNFWKAAGNISIYYVILYIVTTMIVGIPYYIYIFVTMVSNKVGENPMESMTGAMILMYVASTLLQLMANVILQINASVIYYTLIEEENNITSHEEIDSIGQ